MKNLLFALFLSFTSFHLFAQDISFEPSFELIEHPYNGTPEFLYPFIPLDYNEDGHVDLVGSSFGSQYLYKGTEADTFEMIHLSSYSIERPLKAMDFNQDGKIDIIMESIINIYVEADSFTTIFPGLQLTETIIDVADFNEDGLNDLLVINRIAFENDEISIYYNNVDNIFTPTLLYNNHSYYGDISIGDIDNDDDIDIIALIPFNSDKAVILKKQEDNSYTPNFLSTSISLSRNSIELCDLDKDGDLDIITLGSFNNIQIFENTDAFSTPPNHIEVTIDDPVTIQITDLNNDNNLDIVALAGGGVNDGFSIYYLQSIGGFEYNAPTFVENFPSVNSWSYPAHFSYLKNHISIYDFDQDGKQDLIQTQGFGSQGYINLLKNTCISYINNPFKNVHSIEIFPNPSTEEINVSDLSTFPNGIKYQLFSNTGQLLHTGDTNQNVITISTLSPGSYHILLQDRINNKILYKADFIKI